MGLLADEALYREAFGVADCSGPAMRSALEQWLRLYYGQDHQPGRDHSLRLPYTVVRKLCRAVFAEYACQGGCLEALPARQALEQALIAGECYLRPVLLEQGVAWQVLPRQELLIFARDAAGEPTDVGLVELSQRGRFRYTLLERRTLDENGLLTVGYRLFRTERPGSLGREVSLRSHSAYARLPALYTWPQRLGGVGLVRLKLPMANCVDGSAEGVSILAPATGLLEAIAENEAQLRGEFRRGQSRLVVSRDMLSGGQLTDDLFVALDDSPEAVGITVFAPQLREQSYLNLQQAYLRGLENLIGLKRGLLSQVEAVERTATEITSSEGEYMTTILELRRAWEDTAVRATELEQAITGRPCPQGQIHWGDGLV